MLVTGLLEDVAPQLKLLPAQAGEPVLYSVGRPGFECRFHDPSGVVEQVEGWLREVQRYWCKDTLTNNIKPCYIGGFIKVMLMRSVFIRHADRVIHKQNDSTGTPCRMSAAAYNTPALLSNPGCGVLLPAAVWQVHGAGHHPACSCAPLQWR
jgi:hypothetical protein